ncbi:MAG: hypothetical protein OEX07_10865 [Gammaproteobacteria bacterium]|nr:hypothetical protein [Gammaproteobacteria bacterium]
MYKENFLNTQNKDQLVALGAKHDMTLDMDMKKPELVAALLTVSNGGADTDDLGGTALGPGDESMDAEEQIDSDEAVDKEEKVAKEDQKAPEPKGKVAKKISIAERDKGYVQPQHFEKDKVRVIFAESEGKEGKLPVKASLNGRAYEMKRNREVDVPRAILNVLKDAVVYSQEPDVVDGKDVLIDRKVRRYNFETVADPAPKTPPAE